MAHAPEKLGDGFSVFRKISNGPAIAVHGQVFTRPHVVDLMLDLAGYTADKPLHRLTLLEARVRQRRIPHEGRRPTPQQQAGNHVRRIALPLPVGS